MWAAKWRVMAARAAGSSHQRLGTPCQDAFAWDALPDGGIVAAVADGAGSAANAARGAELAVQTTLCQVQAGLEAGRTDVVDLLAAAILSARAAILAEAAEQGAEPRSYASTLLALVLTESGGAAAQLGDGVIVLRADGDLTGFDAPDLTGFGKPVRSSSWSYVTWPQHGEYANTTFFLTGDDAAERLVVTPLDPGITDFALTTDGLERLALQLDTRSVHAPFFDGVLRPLLAAETTEAVARLSPALARFLASERIASRTDDDVTLVIATRQTTGDGQHKDTKTQRPAQPPAAIHPAALCLCVFVLNSLLTLARFT